MAKSESKAAAGSAKVDVDKLAHAGGRVRPVRGSSSRRR